MAAKKARRPRGKDEEGNPINLSDPRLFPGRHTRGASGLADPNRLRAGKEWERYQYYSGSNDSYGRQQRRVAARNLKDLARNTNPWTKTGQKGPFVMPPAKSSSSKGTGRSFFRRGGGGGFFSGKPIEN